MANGTEPMDTGYTVHPAAIAVATGSITIIALILPPMLWHFRNHNFGATVLVAWFVLLNFFNFLNAVIWATDDLPHWYRGAGLCDVEVKLQVAAWAGCAAAEACILRSLARVLDMDRISIGLTKAQRRRDRIIEIMWMGITPVLQVIMHYVVQPNRYDIFGISGCTPTFSYDWVAIVTVHVPPLFWTVVDGWYCVIILIRLHRYKNGYASILASSGTTKSRFIRLFCICVVGLGGSVPLQAWVLFANIRVALSVGLDSYNWSKIHDDTWQQVVLIPSHGHPLYDRLFWMIGGILIFVFFGMGKDAMTMYKAGLRWIGLGTCFPALRANCRPSPRTSNPSLSSLSSKARLLFKRRSLASSWRAKSISSEGTCTATVRSEPEKTCELQGVKYKPHGMTLPTSHSPTLIDTQSVAPKSSNDMLQKSILQPTFVSLGRWKTRFYSKLCTRAFGNLEINECSDLELQSNHLSALQTGGALSGSRRQREQLEVHVRKEVILGRE